MQWSKVGDDVNNYSLAISFGMMFVNIIIFGLLAFYLDQVFPNEFGKKRHPCFFFPCLIRKKKKI